MQDDTPRRPPFVPNLGPSPDSNQAAAELFRNLWERIRSNGEAISAGSRHLPADAAHNRPLHDYRVAMRRTRTLLSHLGKNLDSSNHELPAKHFTRWFAELGKQSGPPRDLDVLLAALPAYFDRFVLSRGGKSLAGGCRGRGAAYSSLKTWFETKRQREYDDFRRVLASPAYASNASAWIQAVASWSTQPSGVPFEAALHKELGRAKKRFRKAIARSEEATAPRREVTLHRVRIQGKKFRYLLEFLQLATPSPDRADLIVGLKALQDGLGRHHDLSLHRAWIESAVPVDAGPDEVEFRNGLLAVLDRQRNELEFENQLGLVRELLAQYQPLR